jgi:hypothetical protein
LGKDVNGQKKIGYVYKRLFMDGKGPCLEKSSDGSLGSSGSSQGAVAAHREQWWLIWSSGGSQGAVAAHREQWWLIWSSGGSSGSSGGS